MKKKTKKNKKNTLGHYIKFALFCFMEIIVVFCFMILLAFMIDGRGRVDVVDIINFWFEVKDRYEVVEVNPNEQRTYVVFGEFEQDGDIQNGPEPIEWEILDYNENGILLISRYVLDWRPYNEETNDATWKTSSIREWLNNDFLNSAFTSDEQLYINLTRIEETGSYSSVYEGGNIKDKIFYLSVDEVMKYFTINSYYRYSSDRIWGAYSQQLIIPATIYAQMMGGENYKISLLNHIFLYKRRWGYTDSVVGKYGCTWSLRDCGYANVKNCTIKPYGHVSDIGAEYETTPTGVRPAMYIRNCLEVRNYVGLDKDIEGLFENIDFKEIEPDKSYINIDELFDSISLGQIIQNDSHENINEILDSINFMPMIHNDSYVNTSDESDTVDFEGNNFDESNNYLKEEIEEEEQAEPLEIDIDDNKFEAFILETAELEDGEKFGDAEWIEEGVCFRVKVNRADYVEGEYAHLADYIFINDDAYKYIKVSYPSKNDYSSSDRYILNGCNFDVYYEDITFDGNKDIVISLGYKTERLGIKYIKISCAYVYEDGEFVYKKSFENIPNYMIDQYAKCIYGWETGYLKEYGYNQKYEYIDGEFVLTEESELCNRQIAIIANNYYEWYNDWNAEVEDSSDMIIQIAIADMNRNNRYEIIISGHNKDDVDAVTAVYEVNATYDGVERLSLNGENELDFCGDFYATDVFTCYKKDRNYYYEIENYYKDGLSEQGKYYYSYSFVGDIGREIIGGYTLTQDDDNKKVINVRFYSGIDTLLWDETAYAQYFAEYWADYEKQPDVKLKWVSLSDSEDLINILQRSKNGYNENVPEKVNYDLYGDNFEYDTVCLEYYGTDASSEYIIEENSDFIHLDVYDDIGFDIPFDIAYANIDLKEITDWKKISLYERCHFDGKVYEFFESNYVLKGCDFTREGLLVITDEEDKDNYQIIEIYTGFGCDFTDNIFYFEDVTYDGTKELLINWGGFGAQLCRRMSCYKYDYEKGMYIEIPHFSEISDPAIDEKREYIFGSLRDGAFGYSYYAYQCINDELVCVYSVYIGYDEGEYILTVNGEEVGRTKDYNDLKQLDNPAVAIFFGSDSRKSWFY